jgi:branched-chain amino acid transport system substrate-binding protein
MNARNWWLSACTALACAAAPASGSAQEQRAANELRIGFLSTTSGGGAVIGRHQVNGWQLGLEHEGWTKDGDKLGGVPTRIFQADDQAKPDVGIAAAEKFLKQDKVQIIAGIIWSSIMVPVFKVAMEAKVGIVGTNAGTSLIAGPLCNPLFISTSWQGDQPSEALGTLITKDKVASIYVLAPNYQGGKDLVSGVMRTMKGVKVVGQDLFKLGETDFQAEISKVRAVKPAALFVFAPGAMGIGFVKQWHASGAGKEIRLYTIHTIDWVTLPAIGEAGVGAVETIQWSPDLDNAETKRFVKDYMAKFGHTPSNFSQQAYDAPRLIAAAVKAVNGKVDDVAALMKAMRKVSYPSLRGPYQYNVNGFPIQNFYRVEVIKGGDAKPTIVNRGVIIANSKDSYWETCPADKRT